MLAWLGGFAVLAGLAFLLTIAVSRGWIGEGARTALAGVLSLGLLGAGVWLRERRGQTEAALAAAAVGIAGTFGTLVVAGSVYELVPRPLALLAAFAVGAGATALATRWRAPVMGWLGLLGALWAPVALGALDGGGIVFLAIAYAATVAVLVWQRWSLLAVFAAFTGDRAVGPVAAGRHAGRRRRHPHARRLRRAHRGPGARPGGEPPRPAPGRDRPAGASADAPGRAWRCSCSTPRSWRPSAGPCSTASRGWWRSRSPTWASASPPPAMGRISRELALILLAAGIVLANVAFASIASGLPLVLGWAASAIPFAALLGARSGSPAGDGLARLFDALLGRPEGEAAVRADRILATAGLLGQIALAGCQALLFDAQPAGARRAGGTALGARRRRRRSPWWPGAAPGSPARPGGPASTPSPSRPSRTSPASRSRARR